MTDLERAMRRFIWAATAFVIAAIFYVGVVIWKLHHG